MRRFWYIACTLALAVSAYAVPALAWSVPKGSVPNFACTDNSYAKAVKHGITLGIYPGAPYTYLTGKNKQPTGIDWDINVAAMHYAGINKIRYQIMPWDSLVPALLADRVDVITGDIHETPSRLKVIGFTSPAWWYGPAIIVPKGNPAKVTSYADLTKKGITVGAMNGSAADEYLQHIGAKIVTYQDGNSEFTSLEQGRESAVLEDQTKFAAFEKANPNAGLVQVNVDPPQDLISTYGYGYARYAVRKGDCTLNFAFSRALAELRAHGVITQILEKWGLGAHNLYVPGE